MKKKLITFLALSSLVLVGCSNKKNDAPTEDTKKDDDQTEVTKKDVIDRWLDTLTGSINIDGRIYERDHLIEKDGEAITSNPTDDKNEFADSETDDTYPCYEIKRSYYKDKYLAYEKDFIDEDGEQRAIPIIQTDGKIMKVGTGTTLTDEIVENHKGAGYQNSLFQDNTILTTFYPSGFDENYTNPLKDYVKDDFKATDANDKKFTLDDDSSINKLVVDLLDVSYSGDMSNPEDPWVKFELIESDDGNKLNMNVALADAPDEEADTNGEKWSYDVFGEFEITKCLTAPFEEVKPREETEDSKKIDKAFKELIDANSYTIHRKATSSDDSAIDPNDYDVKITQQKDANNKIVYSLVDEGYKTGFARFKESDDSGTSQDRYRTFSYTVDDSTNEITITKDNGDDDVCITNDQIEDKKSEYLPTFNGISGTMFKAKEENGNKSYTVDTTDITGATDYLKEHYFYMKMLEDVNTKDNEVFEYDATEDEYNRTGYQLGLTLTLDETDPDQPHLKTISYSIYNIEDCSKISDVTLTIKDINTTTLDAGFDFTK